MKKGFRLLLRLTVFISFFLLADYLFSTSLFSSTSFDDSATEYIDTTTSQEWEEMGVLPQEYLKLHQLSTGAGSVPDQNDQDEEEEEEGEEDEEEEQVNVNSYIGSKKKFINSDLDLMEDQESLTKSVSEDNKGLKKITGATKGEPEQNQDSLKKDVVEKEGEESGNDGKKSNSETIESKDTIAKLQEKNSQSAKSRTILSKEEATSPTSLEVLSKISKDGEKVSSSEVSDQVKDAEVQTKDAIAVNSKNSKTALKSIDSPAAVNNEEPIMETNGHKKDSDALDISKPGKPVEKDEKEVKASKKFEGVATPAKPLINDQVPEPASQSSSEREESNDELEELNKFDFSDHSFSEDIDQA